MMMEEQMTERLVVHNRTELEKYKQVILDNLLESVRVIGELIRDSSALEVFKRFKFDKIAIEPLTGQVENLIEVVNQSQTYLVSLMAVEFLYQRFPNQTFIVNWGNIPGYDIESADGAIIAECFAATSFRSNGKLVNDLKRLSQNDTAIYKYEFFYDKEFGEQQKEYYEEKYSGIEIIKFNDIS